MLLSREQFDTRCRQRTVCRGNPSATAVRPRCVTPSEFSPKPFLAVLFKLGIFCLFFPSLFFPYFFCTWKIMKRSKLKVKNFRTFVRSLPCRSSSVRNRPKPTLCTLKNNVYTFQMNTEPGLKYNFTIYRFKNSLFTFLVHRDSRRCSPANGGQKAALRRSAKSPS